MLGPQVAGVLLIFLCCSTKCFIIANVLSSNCASKAVQRVHNEQELV